MEFSNHNRENKFIVHLDVTPLVLEAMLTWLQAISILEHLAQHWRGGRGFCKLSHYWLPRLPFKVACGVQIWKKKTFFQNIEKCRYNFIKNEIIYMDLTFIYKTPIILSLSKTVALIFTNQILTHLHHLHIFIFRIFTMHILTSWGALRK